MQVTIQYNGKNRQFEDYSELSDFINYDQNGNDDPKEDKIRIVSISDDLPQMSDIIELIEVWEYLDNLNKQNQKIAVKWANDYGYSGITSWDDYYIGVYDSWQDYIEQYIDKCVLPELPEQYRYYFDTEAYARDVRYEDFHGEVELDNGQVAIFRY